MSFDFRGLELNSHYVWNFDWVKKALAFVKDNEMTALVLHRNEIIDQLVYPAGVFAKGQSFDNIFDRYRAIHRDLYKYVARGRSTPMQLRDYLRRVVELADKQGTEVWLENKEIWFHDCIVELNPQVFKGGALCPNEPVWMEFVRKKYEDFFSDFDGIAGIITAPATRESRLSVSGHHCTCELCRFRRPGASKSSSSTTASRTALRPAATAASSLPTTRTGFWHSIPRAARSSC